MIQVRSLQKVEEEIRTFIELLAELGYPQNYEEFTTRIEEFLQMPDYGIGVALDNNSLVGAVAWSKAMTLVTNKTRMRIEALIVNPNYRNKGVGTSLMHYVEEFAQQFRPVIIELTSGIRRAASGAHDFYVANGYVNKGDAEKIYLRKEIL